MVYTRGSLIKHSEQTLFIRFHSANKINRKRLLNVQNSWLSKIYCAATFDCPATSLQWRQCS